MCKKLDVIFDNMAREIREGIPNAMENAITALKQVIGKIIPGTDEANIRVVLKAAHDLTSLAVQKQMEEIEEKLEELMPEMDIPSDKEVMGRIDEVEPLTTEQRHDIRGLFENLEIAHKHLAHLCGLMGMLSWSLSSKQLLLLMRLASVPWYKSIQLRVSWMSQQEAQRGVTYQKAYPKE